MTVVLSSESSATVGLRTVREEHDPDDGRDEEVDHGDARRDGRPFRITGVEEVPGPASHEERRGDAERHHAEPAPPHRSTSSELPDSDASHEARVSRFDPPA